MMEIVRFGSLYKIPTSNGVSRPSAVRGQGFHMINMGELFAYDIINEIPMDRVILSDNEQKKYLVEKGDLLFARQSLVAAGAGKCSIVNDILEPTTFESHLIRVRLDEKLCCSRYYFYLFQLPSNPIKAIVNQCAQAGIRGSELQKIKVPLPPLNEQRHIASILSTYDNLIENNNKRIRLLEQMAENLYKEWFVRFRFPGHEKVEMENGLPKGWKYYLIRNLCEINKKTISSKNKSVLIHYLDTSSITDNCITGYEDYILEDAPSRARRVVKHNSIILSTVRPNLRHFGIIKNPEDNTIVSTGFAVFDCKCQIANIIYRYLASPEIVNYCQSIAEGAVATYPSIKPEVIGRLKIALPPLIIAQQLNNTLEVLNNQQNNLLRQNDNLSRQRDLLLPRLMSGKLEVKE